LQGKIRRLRLQQIIGGIIEVVPDAVIVMDESGTVVFINSAAERIRGFSREEIIGRAYNDVKWDMTTPDGKPLPEEEYPFVWVMKKKKPVYGVEYGIRRPDGTRLTVLVNAAPIGEAHGAILGVVTTLTDITERKQIEDELKRAYAELEIKVKERTEELARANTALQQEIARSERAVEETRKSRREILAILESITDGFFALDNMWRFTYVNKRAEELLGRRKEALLFRNMWEALPELTGTSFYRECHRAKDEKTPVTFEEYYSRIDKWFEVNVYPYENGLSVYFSDITERKRIEEELETSKRLGDALNDINTTIISTLSFDEIMKRVVVESAKALGAEASSIVLREASEWIVSCAYGYPEEIIGVRFSDEESRHAVLAAKTGRPFVSEDTYRDERLDPEVMRRYGIRSTIVVPLMVRQEVIGGLAFNYHTAPVTFTAAQIDFADKLGTTVSLALENARLYEAKRDIADTLQEAILAMPQRIEGIDFGYLYRSATEAARVGGDFYDLFELGNSKVGIAIGDISIKGLEAAALTSLVKNTVRAYAYEDIPVASVMKKTNEAITRMMPSLSIFVTAFFGVLDIKTGNFIYCSAGHPPGILKRRTDETSFLITSSPVIGTFAGLNYIDDEVHLEKGDLLILYTNGVTQAKCDGEFYGDEMFVEFIGEMGRIPANAVPRALFNSVMECTGGELLDDVAILTVSLDESRDM